jgi:hypothetical protein
MVHVLLYAPTQSGKTGTMLSTAFFSQMTIEGKKNLDIDKENIFVITGLSSSEWKRQTAERFPEEMHMNILHGPNLYVTEDKEGNPRGEELKKRLRGMKNVLFMIDEMHVAAKKDQILDKFMIEFNYKDPEFCRENNIKFVHVSATPEGSWLSFPHGYSSTTWMRPGKDYYGLRELVKHNQVRQSFDISQQVYDPVTDETKPTPQCIQGIFDIYVEMQKYDEPRYHIIRCNHDYTDRSQEPAITVQRLKRVMENINFVFEKFLLKKKKEGDEGDEDGDYDLVDMTEKTEQVQDLLDRKPYRHTFIFIKDTTKCAVTISKEFLGVVYERWTDNSHVFKQRKYYHRQKLNDEGLPTWSKENTLQTAISRESFIVQSLAGRLTGYRSRELRSAMKQTVVFTDPLYIHSYIRDTYNYYFNMEGLSKLVKNYLHVERYMDPLPGSTFISVGDWFQAENYQRPQADIPEEPEYPVMSDAYYQMVVLQEEDEEDLHILAGVGTVEYEHDGDPDQEPEFEPLSAEEIRYETIPLQSSIISYQSTGAEEHPEQTPKKSSSRKAAGFMQKPRLKKSEMTPEECVPYKDRPQDRMSDFKGTIQIHRFLNDGSSEGLKMDKVTRQVFNQYGILIGRCPPNSTANFQAYDDVFGAVPPKNLFGSR